MIEQKRNKLKRSEGVRTCLLTGELALPMSPATLLMSGKVMCGVTRMKKVLIKLVEVALSDHGKRVFVTTGRMLLDKIDPDKRK